MNKSKNIIVKDIEAMKSIREFVVAHEEIAANNMRRIREAVVKRRDFLSELIHLYNEIKYSYKKQYQEFLSRHKDAKNAKFSFLKKNSKTACVLLSTNTGLYGDIIKNSYALFKEYLSRESSDPIVIGKVGKRLFEDDNPGIQFKYFDFPDVTIDNDLLRPIILEIIQYEKVIIFHSKFQTLMVQTPTAFVISENMEEASVQKIQTRYIFEPSLDQVIEFFEKEIFSSIFEQTMRESHLSKFASRMVTLDAASDNIKRRLKGLVNEKRQVEHQLANKSQLNSIARMVLTRRI